MAGPRSKRKRPDAANTPLPRRPRRDAVDLDNPEVTNATTTASPPVVPSSSPPEEEVKNDQGESSMDVEDVPHAPLQEQVEIDGAPLPAAEPIEPSSLSDLLAHRKVLLRRVRQGRAAAQKRLELLHKQDPSRKDESKDEEVARFRELARIATSLARKQQAQGDGSAVEKRTSVSLRRGSSVGKRMNAALSTLSGSFGMSLSTAAHSDESEHGHSTTLLPSAVVRTSLDSTEAMPPPPNADAASTTPRTTSASRPSTKDTSQRSSSDSQQDSSSSIRFASQKTSVEKAVSGHHQSRNNLVPMQKGLGRDGKQATISSQQFFSNGLPARPPKLPPSRNSVVCQETLTLRERKARLEEKLSLLFRRRYSVELQGLDSSAMSSSVTLPSPSGVSLANSNTAHQRLDPAKKELSSRLLQEAIRGPDSFLKSQNGVEGRRRKTHWDYVLEEMRWMAADFIEERKWKKCASESVSSAVRLYDNRNAVLPAKNAAPILGLDSSEIALKAGEAPGTRGGSSLDTGSSRVSGGKDSTLYTDPNLDDLTEARGIASQISCMIVELSASAPGMQIETAPFNGRSTTQMKESTRVGRDVELTHAQNLQGSDAPGPMEVSPTQSDVSERSIAGDAFRPEPSFSGQDSTSREAELQKISDYVEHLSSEVDSTNKPKSNATSQSARDIPVTATSGQLAAFLYVDDIWRRLSAGIALKGPSHSGKTVVACSLLWKFRFDGPQLVVCSALSMIRWLHELGRFTDLNRVPLAVDAGISSPSPLAEDAKKLVACDVALCELSFLHSLSEEELCEFKTIVIDTRFPNGFFGSRTPPHEERPKPSENIESPAELLDPSWWSKFSGSKSQPRRLLIEAAAPTNCFQFLRGLPDRQLLEVLALRLSFLLGGGVFRIAGFSTAKSVIAWARRRIRSSGQKGSKFERIRDFLATLLDTFYCEVGDSTRLDDTPLPTWEILACEMPKLQRSAYDQICRESRAALSSRFDSLAEDGGREYASKVAADFLFRLRQTCLHSDIQSCLTTSYGPAQPDREFASRMLTHSGKLRMLLSILLRDCDLDFVVDDCLDSISRNGSSAPAEETSMNSAPTAKRIAVVASLPEARDIVTLLLNCLGVKHDVVSVDVSGGPNVEEQAVAWAKSQLTLSRFNDPTVQRATAHIVVSSLEAVAGDTCGLGVESADLVICLDEDWSGRSELQMKSLLVRSRSRRQESRCRFLKLVAAASCEQAFLSPIPRAGDDVRRYRSCFPYTVSQLGAYSAMLLQRESVAVTDSGHATDADQVLDYFAFPAVNILKWRNKLLSTVLSVNFSVHPLFAESVEMRFLPTDRVEVSALAADTLLINCLVEREANSPPCFDAYKNIGRRDLKAFPSRLHLRTLVVDSFTQYSNESIKPDLHSSAVVPHHQQVNHLVDMMGADLGVSVAEFARLSLGSLLFYNQDKTLSESVDRLNPYAVSYSATHPLGLVSDCNSGNEPLVYFPPLLPRLLECHEAIQTSVAHRPLHNDYEERSSAAPPVKRPRLESDSFTDLLSIDALEDSIDFVVEKLSEEPRTKSGFVSEDEASHKDAASALMDLGDDYGILGIGAIATPHDSIVAAAATSLLTHRGVGSSDVAVTADRDEADRNATKSLDSMVLFVSRKRSRSNAGFPNHSSSSFQRLLSGPPVWALGINSTSRNQEASASLSDANGSNKKMKKKISAHGSGISAFNRLAGPESFPGQARGPAILPSQKSRDIYRSRLLTSLKQSTPGRTLFDAPPFRAAASRVRQRIADRVCHQLWTSPGSVDMGSGLPFLSSTSHVPVESYPGSFRGAPMHWTSVAKPLGNPAAATGDAAIELAVTQSLAFHRSYVLPCRVDFGPFQSGFLSLLSGMASAPPLRPRPGVSLPMGVKVPPQGDFKIPSWSESQSNLLQSAVNLYGSNWVLVSRFLCGYNDFGRRLPRNQIPRAPRDCRDQCKKQAASSLDSLDALSVNAEGPPAIRQEVPINYSTGELHLLSPLTFLHSSATPAAGRDCEMDDPTFAPDDSSEKGENRAANRFGRIMTAKALKETVSISIPGLGVDGSLPQIVASHASHMQAVQASPASAWTSGRTEMWPLQLLDAAERYKTSLAAAAAAGVAPGAPAASAPVPHHHSHPASSSRSASSTMTSQSNGGARLGAPGAGPPASAIPSPSYSRLQPRLPTAGGLPPVATLPTAVVAAGAAPGPPPPPQSSRGPSRPPNPGSAQSFLPPSKPPHHHPSHHQGSAAGTQTTTSASTSAEPRSRTAADSDPSPPARPGAPPSQKQHSQVPSNQPSPS